MEALVSAKVDTPESMEFAGLSTVDPMRSSMESNVSVSVDSSESPEFVETRLAQ